MAKILTLGSSYKFSLHENATPIKAKASKFINNYDPKTNDKNSKYSRTNRYQSEKTETSIVSPSTFISYVESGSAENALQLFDKMNKVNSFAWNSVIRVLTNNGYYQEAIDFYRRMCFEGVRADNFTFPFVIKACGGILNSVEGQKIHSKLFKTGLDLDLYISNSLILMYAKLGYIEFAEKVFDEMRVRDLVSWNSMISAYVYVDDGWGSLICVQKMQLSGMGHDKFTMISALNGCSLVCSLSIGKEIHCQVLRSKFDLDPMVQTSLVDMYGKCHGLNYAERFFFGIPHKSVAAWNAMIGGYALNGRPIESFACFREVQENDGIVPDNITFINLLPSCSQAGSLLMGKSIHGYAIKMGFLPHIVLETALVDMYGKCGEPTLAELVFGQIREKNLISWNTMIAVHVQNGQNREALRLFLEICDVGLKPNATTITSILPAYAEVALVREGKKIHAYAIKLDLGSNTFILNALIYMYAKCGDLKTAQDVFDGIYFKDVISWNTIIMAYAIHGFGEVSLKLFSEMNEKGILPNASTFVSILSSCSIAGMVEEGWKYFISMKKVYGIDPGIEHYGCMLDLLGRVGDLEKVKHFIMEMPLDPTSRTWGSLLAASRHHGDLELAEFAAKRVLSLEHDNTGLYILLSNMYAEAGRWDDVRRIKSLMKCQGFVKTIAISMLEVRGKTYRFTNHDRSHKESSLIYNVLNTLVRMIGENPSVGESKFKLIEFSRRKTNSAEFHSVRLAVCFGLISTSIGTPVLVRKNVRICEDCHFAVKKISGVTHREIVVGDSKIYHHFRHGQCSCEDYW